MRREIQPLQEVQEQEEDGGDGDGGQEKGSDKSFKEAPKKEDEGEGGLSVALKSLFRCTNCSSMLPPPAPLYQASILLLFHHNLYHFIFIVINCTTCSSMLPPPATLYQVSLMSYLIIIFIILSLLIAPNAHQHSITCA